ncbi:UDP-N-acetylglucosamine--N-acetylmuramyl-(pentapeptide) pyrophosphoryl-undecaprenol N-acetylglucosamine transferase [Croceivirga lutea]|uniref:undecaprenyldiphospho-muramoylpentapeptide beta-N-acetylglucosaminyltransferase n=1 Tax=Croceivirga lutea TaxID=1775167 RepID=UPI00163A795C|nr:undecaprenyldiphospho-muramoylpentapeptide beta-N-acetylglucosaminyltransferase [Croceivirga lutea]GGG53242.1 UDP-N-acetylglucosamine--N-acetylmuramyl-(pentapeptide) pyrophosphoryl-undecaprenol N-acetylglucosamine transferase [Croceivirga lutea]
MRNYRFIISGGGTGGHIYPAVAIANELKKRHKNAEFLFVGAKDKMEMEKVPQAGYKIKGLWISGLQRKLTLRNVLFPIKLVHSLIKARSILKQFKPDVAIGTGGFASGPTMKAAAWSKVPYVLQEQNSFAGITNKLSAAKAEKIFVAYEGMEKFFPSDKVLLTGNPVRTDIYETQVDKESAASQFQLSSKQPILLVLGGSLGARRVNQLIEKELPFFKSLGLQVLWQCGKLYYEEYKNYNATDVKVVAFLNRMDYAYSAADFIISRAGAGSVSELCIVGKPTLFIPSPNVAEDHQTKNAEALVEKNAALMLKENDLEALFKTTFEDLVQSTEKQEKLKENIKDLALPMATAHIVDEIEKIIA